MEDKHHYFLAVKLPNEVKEFLHEWMEQQKEDYPFQRWVHPQDYHITLAFLGFAETNMLNETIEQMNKTVIDEQSFELTLNKLGIFGSPKSPRIFWADILPSDSLTNIQKKVYNLCIDIGFELDKKPFRPHITLARKWKADYEFDKQLLKNIINANGGHFTFKVNEIVLYETHLQKSPKYKEFANFSLRKE